MEPRAKNGKQKMKQSHSRKKYITSETFNCIFLGFHHLHLQRILSIYSPPNRVDRLHFSHAHKNSFATSLFFLCPFSIEFFDSFFSTIFTFRFYLQLAKVRAFAVVVFINQLHFDCVIAPETFLWQKFCSSSL